jgi:hypothetical protein
MTSRPTMYTMEVVVNTLDGEHDIAHDKMDFEDLIAILDGYVVGTGNETSWVFTVVKHTPKDWVVVCDPDHEAEVFGPFPERDKAIEWAKGEFATDTDWIIRAIDKPVAGIDRVPVHKIEGTQANFDRYIAGDR